MGAKQPITPEPGAPARLAHAPMRPQGGKRDGSHHPVTEPFGRYEQVGREPPSADDASDGSEPRTWRDTPTLATHVEVALLAMWDFAWVVAVLAATGAFGERLGGWIARLLVALLALIIIGASGCYQRTTWLREHPVQIIGRLLVASTLVSWSGVLVTMALGLRPDVAPLITTWFVLPVAWYGGRGIARLVRRARPERILIVGTGAVGRRVLELSRDPATATVVVGCLEGSSVPAHRDDPPNLGGIDQLPRLLAGGGIDRVIVTFSSRRDQEMLDVLRTCTNYRGAVDIVPRFFDFVSPKPLIYHADGLTFLSVAGRRRGLGKAMLERSIDLAGSIILLVALSPVLLTIAVAILLDSGRPVLFRQRRIGMHGTSFSILKFRTLSSPAETRTKTDAPREDDALWEHDALASEPGSIGVRVEQAKQDAARRATRVGAFLRKTSLDELPQLFNVLTGQMSLVGPRPLSRPEDDALSGWETLRRDVRPGITGLWQVSGRSEVSWENRMSLDYRQVRHWSLSSDLQVLADTVRAVLRRRGAE